MKRKVEEAHVEWLEKIHRTPELKGLLEKLIRDTNKIRREKNSGALRTKAMELISSDLEKRTREISKKFNIEEDAIKLYLTLDRSVYGVVNFEKNQKPLKLELAFLEQGGKAKMHVNGSNITMIYLQELMDEMNFCDENTHLLPDSTQEMVKQLQRGYDNRPKVSKMLNEFEYRVYLTSLEDELNTEILGFHQTRFGWIRSVSERIRTNYYFQKALKSKYGQNKSEELREILRNSLESFSSQVKTTKILREDGRRDTIKDILAKDPQFAKEMASRIRDGISKAHLLEMLEEVGQDDAKKTKENA